MRKRLETVKDELMALHRDMYWMAQDQNSPEQAQKVSDLDFDQVMTADITAGEQDILSLIEAPSRRNFFTIS